MAELLSWAMFIIELGLTEGASQRVQEDTLKFATNFRRTLGTGLCRVCIMTINCNFTPILMGFIYW